MTTTRKYYVLIPAAYSTKDEPYWHELAGIKTLTAAQAYINKTWGRLADAEIAMSMNGGERTVVATQNKLGQWEVIS